MDEEAIPTRIPPASPLTKSGGNKRNESPRSSMSSGGKVVPHYLRASTGSCHEFCKHGRPEEHVNAVKDIRPWRKSIAGNVREDGGVTASIKKTVIVKPKPSADHKIKLNHSKETVRSDMSTTTDDIDQAMEQASSFSTTTVTSEPYTSDGLETTVLMSAEITKQESPLAYENVTTTADGEPVDAEEITISKKSSVSSPGKLLWSSSAPISGGSNAARTADGRKSLSEDKMTSIEGNQSSPEIDSSEESNSLMLKSPTKDDSLGNVKISGKSELSKKHAASPTPKPVTLKMKASPPITRISAKPQSPLLPSSALLRSPIASKSPSPLHPSSAPSRNLTSAKPPSPLHPSSAPPRNPVAAKPPSPLHPSSAHSRNPIAAKSSSPLHPSSGTRSKTITNNQLATKLSTSKLEMKKIDTSVPVSPSSGSSVDGEEISNVKKVRVIRVVSTIRRHRNVTNKAAKVPGDHKLKEDTADAIKITPSKKSVLNSTEETANDSLLTPVSKSTFKPRISHLPPRPKNSLAEPRPKAVDSQPDSRRPITLKSGRVPLLGEITHTNRRSLKKRISSGAITIEKSNSGRILSRRPSSRQKKNVQVLFNKVIEETASRLVRTSKSKVLALVGAFETVISIQRKSSSVSTRKSEKKNSSSKTSE